MSLAPQSPSPAPEPPVPGEQTACAPPPRRWLLLGLALSVPVLLLTVAALARRSTPPPDSTPPTAPSAAPVPAAATDAGALPLPPPPVAPMPAPAAAMASAPVPAPAPQPLAPVPNRFPRTRFHQAVCAALSQRGLRPESVCDPTRPAELRILQEYGAIFVAGPKAKLPPRCLFADDAAVQAFQATAGAASTTVRGTRVTLQPAAIRALLSAEAEAAKAGLAISPAGGTGASRRGLADTAEVWNRYIEEALRHWQRQGRLSQDEVTRLRGLPPVAQAGEALKLEARGLLFGLAQRKSIVSSAAVPGSSQHLSLLALDVTEYANPEVRRILARHGWFQTVLDDFPHFTWLGLAENELPSRGLRPVISCQQTFWVPDLAPDAQTPAPRAAAGSPR